MAWLQSCKQLCLAAHAAHDARHGGEQWRGRRLCQNVGDHLRGGWIVATRDACDIDAVREMRRERALAGGAGTRGACAPHRTGPG